MGEAKRQIELRQDKVESLLEVLDKSFDQEKIRLPLVIEIVAHTPTETVINSNVGNKPARPVFRQKRAFRLLNQS